jgi:hypothetical protein
VTVLFGHASQTGAIKRVRFTKNLDTIIIKILNRKGLNMEKKNRTAVMATGADRSLVVHVHASAVPDAGFWGRGRLSLVFSLLFPYLLF